MKKYISVVLSLVMLLSLSGCTMQRQLLKNPKGLISALNQKTDNQPGAVEVEDGGDIDYYMTDEESYEVAPYMSYLGAPEVYEPDWNTEEYKYNPENGWRIPSAEPFSTFAADVDTASYANIRRMLLEGKEVPKDAVRTEEMINYFDYSYPNPEDGKDFSVTAKIVPCPWNKNTKLMSVGLKAKEIKEKERQSSNIVFLIDVSGSMDEYNKLPLVQRAFRLLINELNEDDTVSVVTYADGDAVVLDGVSGNNKTLICDAIEDLSPGGGTNGSSGITRAYELAEKYFIEGGNNRVILATDGDLNIGITDEGSLTRLIEEKAKSGVFLSVLGFGEGNISDTNMEALADHGNGNYSYIDNIAEARKVLVNEAGGTLVTVAKDVKIQVEFNPKKVKAYRLIGYENRLMNAEDFNNDEKDGGEIGSGHTVTALYEIADDDNDVKTGAPQKRYSVFEPETEPDDYADEWAIVNIRHKKPDEDKSDLTEYIVTTENEMKEPDEDLSWAAGVAQAGMILEGSEYAGDTDISEVRDRLKQITGNDEFREEFVYLLGKIEQIG